MTDVTCGTVLRLATDRSTAALASASSRVPAVAWNTTVAEAPAASGNRVSSRSMACWELVPGTVNRS